MSRPPKLEDGLAILPFWASERAPTWPEDTRGTIVGLTYSTSATDILRATREAVFHRLAQIAEMLPARRFVVSGGIQKSRADVQLLADVLGRAVTLCTEPEASLRGAAVFALEKLGVSVPPPPKGHTVQPRLRFSRHYVTARKWQEQLEKRIGGLSTT